MKTLKLFTLLVTVFTSLNLLATNAIPENRLSVPDLSPLNSHVVSEADFIKITETLYKIYAPKIEEKGGVKLIMNADWSDDTVNAFATREVDSWSVHVAGGIARSPGMTEDSLALIVCHELGHHLAGAPRTFLFEGWPAAEGQADYWAASKCLKNYYQELEKDSVTISHELPEKAVKDCADVYKNLTELKVCIRSMMATQGFSNFLNALPDVKVPTSLVSFDAREVKGTNTNHYPRPQCRVDTVYRGALCNLDPNVATSESDAKLGHCNDTSKPGTRPRCWYKPQ
jgi:hypothetical protein